MSQSNDEAQDGMSSPHIDDSTSIPSPHSERRPMKQRRTVKACDRCRVKKSKCNGRHPCENCVAYNTQCTYSARRRRDVRNWECGMQDVMEEAVHRLYNACNESDSFPGTIDPDHTGHLTTQDIFRGLGLATNPPPAGIAALYVGSGPRVKASSPSASLSSPVENHSHAHDHKSQIQSQNQNQDHTSATTGQSHKRNKSSADHKTRITSNTSSSSNNNNNNNPYLRTETQAPRSMCEQFEDFADHSSSLPPPQQIPTDINTNAWFTYPPDHQFPQSTYPNSPPPPWVYTYDQHQNPYLDYSPMVDDEMFNHIPHQLQTQHPQPHPTVQATNQQYDSGGSGSGSGSGSSEPVSQGDIFMSEGIEWATIG